MICLCGPNQKKIRGRDVEKEEKGIKNQTRTMSYLHASHVICCDSNTRLLFFSCLLLVHTVYYHYVHRVYVMYSMVLALVDYENCVDMMVVPIFPVRTIIMMIIRSSTYCCILVVVAPTYLLVLLFKNEDIILC